MAQSKDIIVPDLGDFENVEVIEILVAAGDEVAPESGIITLETDKAAMDVPSPEAGVIESISVSVGDTVSTGDVIGKMSLEAGESEEDVTADTDEAPDASKAESAEPAGDPADDGQAPAAAAGDDTAPGEVQELLVPDLGDFEDVEVIEVHISVGDDIEAEAPLVTLETDKAAMDVPAAAGGRIESVTVSVGDKVSEGTSLGTVLTRTAPDESGQSAAAPPANRGTQPEPRTGPPSSSSPSAGMPMINEAGFSRAHASPSVRKLARELGVDLVQVKGSGNKNRILHDDVKAFVKSFMTGQAAFAGGGALPETPSVDFAKYGDIETIPLTRIQKIAGPRLQASWVNLPHVTQHDLADITELEAMRQQLKGPAKEQGISLTPLAFILKACVAALQEFPKVNSSLAEDGKSLVLKKYIHLGFAADTEQGLMVPVIRDADKKSVYELAAELGELSAAARDGKLKADQLQGATFTVSSLGGIGGTAFTPIVNAPEVAILGVSRSSMQPVWDGTDFGPRLMLPLSLSYDHRVIDGAAAVRFTTYLGEVLTDVGELLEGSEL